MPLTLPIITLIALGGAAGAVSRFLFGSLLNQWLGSGYPYGTLAVNITGSFLMGVLMEYAIRSPIFPVAVVAFGGIGFLGGFTTFSAFAFDIWQMLQRDNSTMQMIGFVLASVIFSVCAVFAGMRLMKAFAL